MSDYADNLRRSMTNKTRRFMRMVQEMQEKDDAALREQVIRMAREAGWKDLPTVRLAFAGFDLSYFASLVRADEREACAQAARTAMLGAEWPLTERVMRAIRARGEK